MAIETRIEGKLIGDAGLNEVEGDSDKIEVGFSICRDHQGNGYATEALGAITEFAAEHFRAKILYARVLHGNIPSTKVVKKCGYFFVKEEFGAKDDPHDRGILLCKKEL